MRRRCLCHPVWTIISPSRAGSRAPAPALGSRRREGGSGARSVGTLPQLLQKCPRRSSWSVPERPKPCLGLPPTPPAPPGLPARAKRELERAQSSAGRSKEARSPTNNVAAWQTICSLGTTLIVSAHFAFDLGRILHRVSRSQGFTHSDSCPCPTTAAGKHIKAQISFST